MIDLQALAEFARAYGLDRRGLAPVEPVRIGTRVVGGGNASLMATINLSRDSTYRESIATSAASAIRKARIAWAEGATVVDIGAESSTARAARIDAAQQIALLAPVIRQCAADGIAISIEGYLPEVIEAGLSAGAALVNLTGQEHEQAIFDLAAHHDAAVVLCYVGGANVREITEVPVDADPIPELSDHFTRRIAVAREHGVSRLLIDPGLGFYYGNLVDPSVRVQHQARVLLHTVRLRELGFPICHALPHAFDLFEDQFRQAEAFFAVLALLGGTSLLRTHEIARVGAVVRALETLTLHL